MGDKTKIEWADASWNPIRARRLKTGTVGWHCEHVSEGCRNCYAEGVNHRFGTGLDFKPGHRKDIELFLDEDMLTQPLRWRKPRRIFVCSMTDLFADFVTDEMIDMVFAVMALCPQHTFMVLTKRPARMRPYLSADDWAGNVRDWLNDQGPGLGITDDRIVSAAVAINSGMLPNVWLGVSVEDQATAEQRIPQLLGTPAHVHFVSYEPALEPVDFKSIYLPCCCSDGKPRCDNVLGCDPGNTSLPHIDLVIAGGESGPKARPCHPDWMRRTRDQCQAAGVAFFFKQWGEWAPPGIKRVDGAGKESLDLADMHRVGKKAAGRLLDGREWNEMPGAKS